MLAVSAAAALAAGLVIGSAGEDRDGSQPTAPARPRALAGPSCPAPVARDPTRLVGQALIVRMEGRATRELRRRVRAGEIGGVILFPPVGTDPEHLAAQIALLRRAGARGGPTPLVAIDQEGGQVERLPGLPPELSPPQLAARGPAAARRAGERTGRALAGLGVNVDLAPVLDVPVSPAAPIAARSFGSRPRQVAGAGVAFASGLEDGGVAATAKHFPGLGSAAASTDLTPTAVTASPARLARELVPFRAAIAAGTDLVMVSNATYPAYDPARPATFSRPLIEGLLRDRLDYDGVVISDDLGAGALTGAGIAEGEAAVRAASAGVDLVLTALSDGRAAAAALRAALARGRLERRALVRSCARVSALRAELAPRGPQ